MSVCLSVWLAAVRWGLAWPGLACGIITHQRVSSPCSHTTPAAASHNSPFSSSPHTNTSSARPPLTLSHPSARPPAHVWIPAFFRQGFFPRLEAAFFSSGLLPSSRLDSYLLQAKTFDTSGRCLFVWTPSYLLHVWTPTFFMSGLPSSLRLDSCLLHVWTPTLFTS